MGVRLSQCFVAFVFALAVAIGVALMVFVVGFIRLSVDLTFLMLPAFGALSIACIGMSPLIVGLVLRCIFERRNFVIQRHRCLLDRVLRNLEPPDFCCVVGLQFSQG